MPNILEVAVKCSTLNKIKNSIENSCENSEAFGENQTRPNMQWTELLLQIKREKESSMYQGGTKNLILTCENTC